MKPYQQNDTPLVYYSPTNGKSSKWLIQTESQSNQLVINQTYNLSRPEKTKEKITDILEEKPFFPIEVDGTKFNLPLKYLDLINEIKGSEYLKSYSYEDDDTGATVIFKESTWKLTIKFLLQFANWTFKEYGCFIPTPSIIDGENGSIDIHWKGENYRLLMNFSSDDKFATFYGDNYGKESIKGKIDFTKFNGLKMSSILGIIINHELPC